MNCSLEKLVMINFKGQKNVTIDFTEKTDIYGENKVGKTTISDAVYFVLYGKNSEDQSKFGIKTFDENGIVIPHLDHSVTAYFKIDESTEVFERIIKEEWVKPHGETEKIYKGDKTVLKINASPKSVSNFNAEIERIITPGLFKLLSNPLEFNRLAWEKRRKALIDMAGEIEESKILDSLITVQNKGEYLGLINTLNSNKTLLTRKDELKGQIEILKEELSGIAPRIAEVEHNKPEVLPWAGLEAEMPALTEELESIESSLLDDSKRHQIKIKDQSEIIKQIGSLEIELQNYESNSKLEANKEINKNKELVSNLNLKIINSGNTIKINQQQIEKKENKILYLKSDKDSLISAYYKINERTFIFPEDQTTCPTCKQEIPEDQLKDKRFELEENFNVTTAELRTENINKGKQIATEIKELEIECETLKGEIKIAENTKKEAETQVQGINVTEKIINFSMDKEWNDFYSTIEKLKESQKEFKLPENTQLNERKVKIQSEIESLKNKLKGKTEIEKSNKRIAELQKKQNDLSQQIADLEQEESVISQFEKAKMDILETRVNSMFTMVKFRMFEAQKNGGEKPDCITLVNGVPFNDTNTASKINAGLDIINVLSQHYQKFVPVIIDNRESVTEILPMKSQVINLTKKEGVLKLTTSECDAIKQQIEYFKGNESMINSLNLKYDHLKFKNDLKTLTVK